MLPQALECQQDEISNETSAGHQRMWDFVAAGLLLDCRPERIDAQAPPKLPPGYFTDLWMFRTRALHALRRHPQYIDAQQRVEIAQTLECEYDLSPHAFVGTCDDMCRRFSTLEDAQQACVRRPTC